MVRIAVIGAVPDPVEEYPDGSNTKSVKEDLLGGYGKGILKRNKVGVLTETLQAGEYEYYVTPQQGKKHHQFTFIYLRRLCLSFSCYIFLL